MMATCFKQGLDDVRRCRVGATERPARSFRESFGALLLESVDPFVAGLAAYTVAAAHFGDGIEIPGAVGDEQEFLVHG
jgi:hypothetical protein